MWNKSPNTKFQKRANIGENFPKKEEKIKYSFREHPVLWPL
jgi:hypothetical protein